MLNAFVYGVQKALEDAGLAKYADDRTRLLHARAAAKLAFPETDVPYSEQELINLMSALAQMQGDDPGSAVAEDELPAEDDNKPDQGANAGERVVDSQYKAAGIAGYLSRAVAGSPTLQKGLKVVDYGGSVLSTTQYLANKNKNRLNTVAPMSREILHADRKLRGF